MSTTTPSAEDVIASCSFCGKPNTEVQRLVAGPGVAAPASTSCFRTRAESRRARGPVFLRVTASVSVRLLGEIGHAPCTPAVDLDRPVT